MGGIMGVGRPAQQAAPPPDTSALDEQKRQNEELKRKNEARMRNIRGRGGSGREKLLAFSPTGELSNSLGG